MDLGRRSAAMVRSTRGGGSVGAAMARLETASIGLLVLADEPWLRALATPLDRLTSGEIDLGVLDDVIDAAMIRTESGRQHFDGHARRAASPFGTDSEPRGSRFADRLRSDARSLSRAPGENSAGRRSTRHRHDSGRDAGAPVVDTTSFAIRSETKLEGVLAGRSTTIGGGATSVGDLTRPLRPRRRHPSDTTATSASSGRGSTVESSTRSRKSAAWSDVAPDSSRERGSEHTATAQRPELDATWRRPAGDPHDGPADEARADSLRASTGGIAELVDRWSARGPAILHERLSASIDAFPEHLAVDLWQAARGGFGDHSGDEAADAAFPDQTLTEQVADALDDLLRREAEQHGLDGSLR